MSAIIKLYLDNSFELFKILNNFLDKNFGALLSNWKNSYIKSIVPANTALFDFLPFSNSSRIVLSINTVNENDCFSDLKTIKKFLDLNRSKIQKHKTEINCSNIKTYKNDVIFIKYDANNLKYLYMCTNCLTSWKNK